MAILIRSLALGAGIAAYFIVAPRLSSTPPGDPDIGLGLLAFGLLVVAASGWGFVDGTRRVLREVATTWAGTALVVSVGWLLVLSVGQADESMSATELMRADAGLLPFTFGIVLVPALAAGAIGSTARRTR